MKLTKRSGALVAGSVATAMLLSACGGSDGDGGSGGGEGGGEAAGGSYSIYVGEPENPLVPGNTTESEGHQVISALWTGLITYAADGEVEFDGVAESIESEDNTTWTVTLNDGWTFHDGTPVTAQSFVDAWNYTAYSPNAQGASYFFSNILGYDDLQAPVDEATGEPSGDPAAEEMSGLEVIDENTFEVTLASPFAQFPVTVGYNAFWPLPEAFFEDPEGFGRQPIGNGPYQVDEEFSPGTGFTVSRYEDYAGEAGNAEEVEFRVYADLNTGYTDLQAGNLDVLPDVPPDALASIADEFGERYLEAPSSGFTYLGFPTYDERFSDPQVRQAFSMAVDRQAISDAIFNGTRTPADAFVAPVVDGYREGACTYCELDVDAANQLLDEAGFDRSQPVELWFNAGAGHDAWVQAVGNQLRDNLGIEYTLRGELDFAEYLPLLDEQGVTGPFRLGWAMDYPSPQNYLEPLYSTAALPPAGSNATFYTNPEFDELINQGNSAESNEQAIEFYNQAEDLLLEDMPSIPMFFDLEQAAHSEDVSNVVIDVFGDIDVPAVTVNG